MLTALCGHSKASRYRAKWGLPIREMSQREESRFAKRPLWHTSVLWSVLHAVGKLKWRSPTLLNIHNQQNEVWPNLEILRNVNSPNCTKVIKWLRLKTRIEKLTHESWWLFLTWYHKKDMSLGILFELYVPIRSIKVRRKRKTQKKTEWLWWDDKKIFQKESWEMVFS